MTIAVRLQHLRLQQKPKPPPPPPAMKPPPTPPPVNVHEVDIIASTCHRKSGSPAAPPHVAKQPPLLQPPLLKAKPQPPKAKPQPPPPPVGSRTTPGAPDDRGAGGGTRGYDRKWGSSGYGTDNVNTHQTKHSGLSTLPPRRSAERVPAAAHINDPPPAPSKKPPTYGDLVAKDVPLVEKHKHPDRRITIYTAGYRYYVFKAHINNKDSASLAAKIQDKHFPHGEWKPDVISDCSSLRVVKPDCEQWKKKHTGEHPQVLCNVITHRKFKSVIQTLLEDFYNNAKGTDDRGEVNVLCYCPKGSKRSVAVARCFAHFLIHHGYDVRDVVHLNIDRPHRRGCDQCNNVWLEGSTERQRLLNIATNRITEIFKDETRVRNRDP